MLADLIAGRSGRPQARSRGDGGEPSGIDTAVRAAKKKATTAAVTSGKQGEVVGIKTTTGLTARLVVVK